MGIRAALHHKTVYEYDRPVTLASQIVRLRRIPVTSYSLRANAKNLPQKRRPFIMRNTIELTLMQWLAQKKGKL